MNNTCEVLSQKLVYLTNLETMLKFILEKPGKFSNQKKREK